MYNIIPYNLVRAKELNYRYLIIVWLHAVFFAWNGLFYHDIHIYIILGLLLTSIFRLLVSFYFSLHNFSDILTVSNNILLGVLLVSIPSSGYGYLSMSIVFLQLTICYISIFPKNHVSPLIKHNVIRVNIVIVLLGLFMRDYIAEFLHVQVLLAAAHRLFNGVFSALLVVFIFWGYGINNLIKKTLDNQYQSHRSLFNLLKKTQGLMQQRVRSLKSLSDKNAAEQHDKYHKLKDIINEKINLSVKFRKILIECCRVLDCQAGNIYFLNPKTDYLEIINTIRFGDIMVTTPSKTMEKLQDCFNEKCGNVYYFDAHDYMAYLQSSLGSVYLKRLIYFNIKYGGRSGCMLELGSLRSDGIDFRREELAIKEILEPFLLAQKQQAESRRLIDLEQQKSLEFNQQESMIELTRENANAINSEIEKNRVQKEKLIRQLKKRLQEIEEKYV